MKKAIGLLILVFSLSLTISLPAKAATLEILNVRIQNSTFTMDGVESVRVDFWADTSSKISGGTLTATIENDVNSPVYTAIQTGHVFGTVGDGPMEYTYYFTFSAESISGSDTLPPSKTFRYNLKIHDELDTSMTATKTGLFQTAADGKASIIVAPSSTTYTNNPAYSTDPAIHVAYLQCLEDIVPNLYADLNEFSLRLDMASYQNARAFLCEGLLPEITVGKGERRALLRDYFDTIGYPTINFDNILNISKGLKPVNRNLVKEQANVTVALKYFTKIFGHSPVFNNAIEDLSWNTLMYRIRFQRNLTLEAAGIVKFRQIFLRLPSSPLDWSAVRILGYIKQ